MILLERFELNSIRGRLWAGFGALVALLVLAGLMARRSFEGISETISTSLTEVQSEAQLASQLSADVAKTIEAGARYIDSRDTTADAMFRRFGWAAHEIQRQMNDRPGQTAAEVATVATIDGKLSEMEIDYALAHRMVDLGRVDEARQVTLRTRGAIDDLLNDIARLGKLKADKLAGAKSDLANEAERRATWLIALIGLAVVLGVLVVFYTVRHIGEPLDVLVQHATRLSEGDLTSRAGSRMPGEFSILASAMNQTGESLSRVVAIAARTADEVSSSAHDLASVSEQISLSASQMASAMTEVSHGAEAQVQQLRSVDDTLQAIREAADGVQQRSSEVTDLARSIEGAAQSKRIEIDRALGILVDIKHSVERAAGEISGARQRVGGAVGGLHLASHDETLLHGDVTRRAGRDLRLRHEHGRADGALHREAGAGHEGHEHQRGTEEERKRSDHQQCVRLLLHHELLLLTRRRWKRRPSRRRRSDRRRHRRARGAPPRW